MASGYDKQQINAATGSISQFTNQEMADAHTYGLALRGLAQLDYDVELLLKLTKNLPITVHTPLSLGLVTAPTLKDGLEFAHRFANIPAGIMRAESKITDQNLAIEIHSSFSIHAVDNLVAGLMFGILDQYLKLFTGTLNNASRIELRSQQLSQIETFKRVFKCKIIPNSPTNSYVIDTTLLAYRSPLADIITFHGETEKCNKLRKQQKDTGNIIDAVQEAIYLTIGEGADITKVANALNLTPRQVRYLLSKRNTNFQEQVKHCKLTVAKKLLQDESLHLSEVGYHIGFSEVSNFSSAFKKWTGVSPSQFRRQLHLMDR